MPGARVNIPPTLTALLKNFSQVPQNTINEVAETCLAHVIIEAPKSLDEGEDNLATSHYINSPTPLIRQICTPYFYWIWVVNGHRVLHTDKAVRWWFGVYLKEHGSYQGKGKGRRFSHGGKWKWTYIPPDNYPQRAMIATVRSGVIPEAVRTSIASKGVK